MRTRPEQRDEFAELRHLSETYWALAEQKGEVEAPMKDEAIRLVREGKMASAVAHITGWTSGHVTRLADLPPGPKPLPEEAEEFTTLRRLVADCDPQSRQGREKIRAEVVRLMRASWEEGLPKRATAIARVTGWSRQHVTLLDPCKQLPVHASPAFDRLRELAEPVMQLRKTTHEAWLEMRSEAIRLVRKGRAEGTYGQLAAVHRVTRWTREHVTRIADEDAADGA